MLSDYHYLRKWLKQADLIIKNGEGSSPARLNEKKQIVAGKSLKKGLLKKVSSMKGNTERELVKSVCLKTARKADQLGCEMGLEEQFTRIYTQFDWQSATIEGVANTIRSLVDSAHGQAIETVSILEKSINTGFSRHCNELSELTESDWFSRLLEQLNNTWKQFHAKNNSDKDLSYFKNLLVETTSEKIRARQEADEAPDETLINCVSEAINQAITEFVNKHQKDRKDIEWVVYPINSLTRDQENPMASAQAYAETPKALQSITSQQLIASGLIATPLEYKAFSEDLGRIYMEWPGIEPRLKAFRQLQVFNPGLSNDDFSILMRRWSYDEQERWCNILNNTPFENNDAASPILAEVFRQAIHTLGRNGHLHPRVLNAIQFIGLKSLSTSNIIDQLQAFSTLCYGLDGQCLSAEEMAGIINKASMSPDTIQKIINAWHDPEELEELADELSEGRVQP